MPSLLSPYGLFRQAASRPRPLRLLVSWGMLGLSAVGWSAEPPGDAAVAEGSPVAQEGGENVVISRMYIREYRVTGAKLLPRIEVEDAVYPFLGPGRTNEDVEAARIALQTAYHEKGYSTVTVRVPEQSGRRGIVVLEVVEAPITRLRVKGSRYFSPAQIKRMVPSLAEGRVPNFKEVNKEIVRLNLPNRFAGRQVLPEPMKPGRYEVDLIVKDELPLHGSLELNNRFSPDTTELRVNGSLSSSNLWQAGHTAGFSFQVAPERTEDAKVFSGYYMAPVPGVDWLNVMLLGTKQDSNVSTLGGSAVAGRGYIIGGRANITLPAPYGRKGFFHSISLGLDYKYFDEDITVGTDAISTPIDYYPISAAYGATWLQKNGMTELNAAVNFNPRGLGADEVEFDAKRYKAGGSYIYFRGDVAHTQDLPGGLQAYLEAQGQMASQPLINSEQFSGGGLGSVRGYLESEALGDNALFGTLELRTPSLFRQKKKAPPPAASQPGAAAQTNGDEDEIETGNEWRFHAFLDGGILTLNDPLPEQADTFELASVGVGTRFRLWNHLNGSLDAGFPLIGQGRTSEGDWRLTFRLWTDF
jgi:hemolysin activation/secretion protein